MCLCASLSSLSAYACTSLCLGDCFESICGYLYACVLGFLWIYPCPRPVSNDMYVSVCVAMSLCPSMRVWLWVSLHLSLSVCLPGCVIVGFSIWVLIKLLGMFWQGWMGILEKIGNCTSSENLLIDRHFHTPFRGRLENELSFQGNIFSYTFLYTNM